MNLPPKTAGDAVAVTGALASFFNAIPWSQVAGFVSAIYLAVRLSFYLWDRWHGRRGD